MRDSLHSAVIHPGLLVHDFENFELSTLVLNSNALKGNPLGDSTKRRIPIMTPKGVAPASGWPVVLMLSGFTGNGPQTFNVKAFETTSPFVLDQALGAGGAPRALYVFCDAMTSWGGSQFIDSVGLGNYATYILDELCSALTQTGAATHDRRFWCVMGGSSGGYGALQLASLKCKPQFAYAIAIAPDSFFEASLLPELRKAIPIIERMGGIAKVRDELKTGKLAKRKEWHTILNAVAMSLCYAPLENGLPKWPIDRDTGLIVAEIWKEWLRHDPLVFLQARKESIKHVQFYLDVGDRDQFQLQYGTRQIRDLLKALGASVDYVGFEGTHFDIGERRLPAWNWLASKWRV